MFGRFRGGEQHDADGLAAFFVSDHRTCDALWAAVEQAVDGGGPADAAWAAFDGAMRRHFAMEEEVLFPEFEAATGMAGGPTAVMRMEHDQMRHLLDAIGEAVGAGAGDRALDLGDTLLMFIQQHNAKEEGMLYPMAEQQLAWEAVKPRLQRYA